jgi:hypothetical protein
MKPERILIILSIIGVIFLLILTNFNKPILIGEVKKIEQTKNSIKIELKNHPEEILIINKTKIEKIKEGETIKIYGDKQISLNKTTIFVNKITR